MLHLYFRLPSVEDPIVVPRRIILHTQSEVNLSDRRTIYPYHIAYRQPDSNDNSKQDYINKIEVS